jgi:hypothetical protein
VFFNPGLQRFLSLTFTWRFRRLGQLVLQTSLLISAALGGTCEAAAEPSGVRVVVGAPVDASALLKEALVRAQGELAAVGLRADVEIIDAGRAPPLPSGVYGLLALEQRAGVIVIQAWAPRARRPIAAQVELTTPGITAEVIAVRAVETLRAAMLQFAQTAGGDVPPAVRGFTRFTPDPAAAPTQSPAPTARRSARLAPPLAFWAGPAVSLHAGTAPDLGAQLGVLVGPSFGFAAAAFETTLGDLHLQAPQGSADVRRQAVWAQLGARFRPARTWEVATRVGFGYAAFAIEGRGELGYSGRSATHGSPTVMLGVSTAYWATRSFGLYASVGGRLALDAPTILIAEKPVITLDRPSFVLSLGSSVGVF